MQSIGERLEEARKRLGISLREASEATKIRMDYLQHMENGSFAFSLPDVYKRGFLKIYARHLKLDAEKLATDFNAQSLASSRLARRDHLGRVELPGREGGVTVAGEEPATFPSTGHGSAGTEMIDQKTLIRLVLVLLGAIALLVVIFYGVEKFIRSDSGSDNTGPSAQASTPPAPAPDQSEGTETAPPATPGLELVLSAKDDISRLTVRQVSDRKVLYDAPLTRGQSADITADGRVEIMVTAAENLHIEQDHQVYALKVTGMQDFYWPTKAMSGPPPGASTP
jgi:cytoskeletal protein RodZ